jgi:deoxyribonuclease-4
MEEFDTIVGLDKLEAIHLNDTKHDLGSGRDRHEHIGKGLLGLDGFRHILNDPRLNGLPGLLETPKSDDLHEDAENLAVLRSLIERNQ